VPDTVVISQTNPQNHNHLFAATYDDAGNVKTGFGAVYTYDGTGMVRRATVGTDIRDFVYTADDERIAVRQGASWTWTVRDQGGKVLREFTSLETSPSPLTLTSHYWSKDYVWRSGLLMASIFPTTPGSTSPTTTYHYHLDHLGTPRLVTDGNHILVSKHTYYPFGAEMNLTPTESATELMKFTGHERDIVTATNGSVDYMHARYYNANLGRFLEIDPGPYDAHKPQTWNHYSYVINNPINKTDPSGRCFWDLCVGEATLMLAGSAAIFDNHGGVSQTPERLESQPDKRSGSQREHWDCCQDQQGRRRYNHRDTGASNPCQHKSVDCTQQRRPESWREGAPRQR
jgi:RHS repeat-associated protein